MLDNRGWLISIHAEPLTEGWYSPLLVVGRGNPVPSTKRAVGGLPAFGAETASEYVVPATALNLKKSSLPSHWLSWTAGPGAIDFAATVPSSGSFASGGQSPAVSR